MTATSFAHITTLARAAAVLVTLGLFTIGSIPAAGLAFPGTLHWLAHLAAYALFAFAYGLGWPLRPAARMAVLVATIGAIHEITEIFTRSHDLETEDVIVNAIGALIGMAVQRAIRRAIIL